MALGGAVPFVESHMETELQFVAEKLKIVEGGKKEKYVRANKENVVY